MACGQVLACVELAFIYTPTFAVGTSRSVLMQAALPHEERHMAVSLRFCTEEQCVSLQWHQLWRAILQAAVPYAQISREHVPARCAQVLLVSCSVDCGPPPLAKKTGALMETALLSAVARTSLMSPWLSFCSDVACTSNTVL